MSGHGSMNRMIELATHMVNPAEGKDICTLLLAHGNIFSEMKNQELH
jgi:hypothetical protein